MGQVMTHVANASGGVLHVYYSTDRMIVETINQSSGMTAGASKLAGASMSVSQAMEMAMVRDPRIRYIRVPRDDYVRIEGEGAVYATVWVEKDGDNGDWLCISSNFHIPSDRSFIVTKQNKSEFQKYGESLWVDEYGNRHRP